MEGVLALILDVVHVVTEHRLHHLKELCGGRSCPSVAAVKDPPSHPAIQPLTAENANHDHHEHNRNGLEIAGSHILPTQGR